MRHVSTAERELTSGKTVVAFKIKVRTGFIFQPFKKLERDAIYLFSYPISS